MNHFVENSGLYSFQVSYFLLPSYKTHSENTFSGENTLRKAYVKNYFEIRELADLNTLD